MYLKPTAIYSFCCGTAQQRRVLFMPSKLLCALCALCIFDVAHGATSPTAFSQYGQIQNVQTYSSNPFWNPNGPYNQRMPQVVYADGPEINAGDCQRVVSALVANVCATINNCVGTQLSDVRPTLMLQLSQLPGHNYATSCSGYIDSEYESYVKQYGHAGTSTGVVAFPSATKTTSNQPQAVLKNPMAQQLPQWQQDVLERTQELENLQAQNSSGSDALARAEFPATFNDLSYKEQMDYLAKGYEQYKGKSAYATMDIDSMDAYNQSRLNPNFDSNTNSSNSSNNGNSSNNSSRGSGSNNGNSGSNNRNRGSNNGNSGSNNGGNNSDANNGETPSVQTDNSTADEASNQTRSLRESSTATPTGITL